MRLKVKKAFGNVQTLTIKFQTGSCKILAKSLD